MGKGHRCLKPGYPISSTGSSSLSSLKLPCIAGKFRIFRCYIQISCCWCYVPFYPHDVSHMALHPRFLLVKQTSMVACPNGLCIIVSNCIQLHPIASNCIPIIPMKCKCIHMISNYNILEFCNGLHINYIYSDGHPVRTYFGKKKRTSYIWPGSYSVS